MGQDSNIAWTDHTFNPWWGCARVSPGCEHCYAERLATVRRKLPVWGVDADRKPMSEAYWREPLKWNRKAQAAGVRARVFCASMADVFELLPDRNRVATEVQHDARARLWPLIESTPWLDWLLLTKRPQNVPQIAPWPLTAPWPDNVWLGTTCEDQQRANERLPVLLRLRRGNRALGLPRRGPRVLFVSYEPALGPVDWTNIVYDERPGPPPSCTVIDALGGACDYGNGENDSPGLDWMIVGGESGPGARPFALEWAMRTLDQCRNVGTRFFMKQLGAQVVSEERTAPKEMMSNPAGLGPEHFAPNGEVWAWKAGLRDRKGGDLREWPPSLQIQEFPRGLA